MTSRTLRLLATALVAGLLATPAAPARAQRPRAPEPDAALRERLLETHAREADAKTRAVEAWRGAVAEATPNQALYDVTSYALDLTLNPMTQILSGTVTVTAQVTGVSIATLDLDLAAGMNVSAATAGGVAAAFAHPGAVVTVTLDRSYGTGEFVQVSVTYAGNPAGASFGWGTQSGSPMIWTLSEPFGARTWWPCKDLNTDKADTVDVVATVPNTLIVASNGVLISDVTVGPDRTFHWRSGHPIAPYLVSLAIHPYTVITDSWSPPGGGPAMPLQNYLFANRVPTVSPLLPFTGPMLTAFSEGFGIYPFADEKYGHADFLWGGAMEHQTLTSMGFWNEDVIAHEMAHQWFGDLITCADFGHVWLNEGFATWCEAYWHEVAEGEDAYRQYMTALGYYGGGTIFVEDPATEPIFDGNLSYNKGGWVVHMLRGVMGDPAFFAGLADYRAQYGYGSATTEQLRDVMEAASGLDLDAFFQQWIYGEYFPVYRATWSQNGGTLDLTLEQTQTNAGPFTMPVPLRIKTTTGTTDVKVQNSLASEAYSIPVSGAVLSVVVDPDRWILHMDDSPVTNVTLAQGILLVNGVSWDTYPTEIYPAYEAKAFWGDLDISFWDTFPEPAGGYPSTLPAPLGHGNVPPDVIGTFSTVLWIGNNFGGDLSYWALSPIVQYLEAGGNVLLVTRMGSDFLGSELASYAGITWSAINVQPGTRHAVYPGLIDIPNTGSQTFCDVFGTAVGPNSTLLFSGTGSGFVGTQGFGVHAQPPGGGTHRADGGRFVYLAGRPYRMQAAALSTDIEFIVDHFFGEPYVPLAVDDAPLARGLRLAAAEPNPSRGPVALAWETARDGAVDLAVYDAAGRRVRTLARGDRTAGPHTALWDGTDERGRAAAPGTYFVRLQAGGVARTRSIVRMR